MCSPGLLLELETDRLGASWCAVTVWRPESLTQASGLLQGRLVAGWPPGLVTARVGMVSEQASAGRGSESVRMYGPAAVDLHVQSLNTSYEA